MSQSYNNPNSQKSVEVNENTDTDEALEEARDSEYEEKRSNDYRRSNLESYATLLANQNLNLSLKNNLPTAYIDQTRLPPRMAITSREVEQPATTYDRDVYDYIAQKAFVVHECGHALYTDNDAKMKRVNQIEPHLQPIAHNMWNVFEDGAIEEAMRNEFSDRITDLLRILNENLRGGENDYSESIDDIPPHIKDNLTDEQLDELEQELEKRNAGPRQVGFFQAIMIAAMDLTVWNSGQTNGLITESDPELLFESDEARENFMDWLPRVMEVSADVLSTPDPVRRTNIIFDFWDELEEFMKDEDMIPDADDLPDMPGGKPNDADSQMGDGQQAAGLDQDGDMQQHMEEVVENGGGGGGGQPQDMDDLTGGSGDGDENDTGEEEEAGGGGDGDEDEEEDAAGVGGDDEDAAGDDEDGDSASGDGDEDDDGDDAAGSDGDDDSDSGMSPSQDEPSAPDNESPEQNEGLAEDLRGKIQQEQEQASGVDDDLKDEMDAFKDMMDSDNGSRQSGNTPLEGLEFQIHRGTGDDKDWSQAMQDGQSLANILHEKLRQEKKKSTRRNQRRGNVDRSQLPNLVTSGNTRIFKKTERGGEKDYSCIVVLDRSGSMGGRDIQVAEQAVGAFMYALDEVGIDACLMDMYRNNARIVSPFGQQIKAAHGGIYSGEAGGSTPLSDCLFAARERLEMRGGNPFVIVITDGHPDDNEEYMNQLRQCHMPVLGVLLNLGQDPESVPDWMDEQKRNYHREKMVFNSDQLSETLEQLAWSVMF